MERTMTVEEKIRRAEEIYARRQAGSLTKTATVNINTNTKKDLKLLKKNDNTNNNKSFNILYNIYNSKQQLHIFSRFYK